MSLSTRCSPLCDYPFFVCYKDSKQAVLNTEQTLGSPHLNYKEMFSDLQPMAGTGVRVRAPAHTFGEHSLAFHYSNGSLSKKEPLTTPSATSSLWVGRSCKEAERKTSHELS